MLDIKVRKYGLYMLGFIMVIWISGCMSQSFSVIWVKGSVSFILGVIRLHVIKSYRD